jgi:CheY-like chemotaxis protein
MVMPEGMTGRELAERLKREKPTLKVLYTSGYSQEILGNEVPLVPGLNFLPKPFSPAQIVRTVRDCLDAGKTA